MKQYYYRVLISYHGGNYFGWQDLGDEEAKVTVQGTITQVLRKICKYADCTVSGASRTDAGVHAEGQVAKIILPIAIAPDKLQLGLNSLLPEDIRILQCASCPADFNPNREAIRKKYRYYFSTDQVSPPILKSIVAHIPARLAGAQGEGSLNLAKMNEACALFVGEHDFYSFASNDKNIDSTVRTITSLKIVKAEAMDLVSEVYYFEIEGTGFLKHMVRYIVGAIIALGRGALDSEEIAAALNTPREKKLSARAKVQGLHLNEITY